MLVQAEWMLTFSFCILVPFSVLGWLIYQDFTMIHIPPEISQGRKLCFTYLFMRIFLRLGEILETLGICREVDVLRFIINGISPVGASDLIIKEVLFDTVPVRVYSSKSSRVENRRGLVWIHGGGGVVGSLKSHQRLCCFFAQESATVIVCIGYPLAPEHPYPAQQLICYTAILHFLKNAQNYRVDPQRIMLPEEIFLKIG